MKWCVWQKRGEKTGKTKRKRPKKGKGFDKRFIFVVFVAAFLITAFLLSLNEPSDKIFIANLELEEGNQSYIHFDMKHTFSSEKECFAEITLYQNQSVISSTLESLGFVKPNKVVSRSLLMQFPGKGIDFRVDIDCK